MSTPAAYRSFWARAPHERRSLALGLDDADDLSVDVEDVVGSAGGHRELTDGNAPARERVGVCLVLDQPARLGQHRVDLRACLHLVERRGALRALDDGLACGGGNLARLEALAVVLLLMSRPQLCDLRPQFLVLHGVRGLGLFRAGDERLGLGTRPSLGLQAVARLGKLHARLGQRAAMPLQRLFELSDFLRLGRGCLARECRRYECGDGPCAAHGPVEEVAQLPAQLQRFECLRRVEEVVVRGVVPASAQLVESVTAPADEYALSSQRVEAIDLPGAFDAGSGTGDELLGEHLTELASADVRGVRVGQDGELCLGTVDRQERLMSVQPPEVGRRLRQFPKPIVTTVSVHAPLPQPLLVLGPSSLRSRTIWGGRTGRAKGNVWPLVSRGAGAGQNLMLPIMLAMFVVRSLIVGAMVEEAR